MPRHLRRMPGKPAELRVLPGLYWHRITEESGKNFFADTWKVAPEADRIGYRFRSGRPLAFVERQQPFGAGSDPSNIVDACYPYGSIQVPGGTEPIVLHRDAVSGGGYFMIGTVISADMDLSASCSRTPRRSSSRWTCRERYRRGTTARRCSTGCGRRWPERRPLRRTAAGVIGCCRNRGFRSAVPAAC